jgi:GABA(A) receptor-associated protein
MYHTGSAFIALNVLGISFVCDTEKGMPFKTEHAFEYRAAESKRIRGKYPDRVPCIVELAPHAQPLTPTPPTSASGGVERKYLVPRDMSVGPCVYVIRKRFKL